MNRDFSLFEIDNGKVQIKRVFSCQFPSNAFVNYFFAGDPRNI
jgi:hypothetical protein